MNKYILKTNGRALKIISLILTIFLLTNCSLQGQFDGINSQIDNSSLNPTQDPEIPDNNNSSTGTDYSKMAPLAWENTNKYPERSLWSIHLYKLIENELSTSLWPGSSDIELFCPKYNTLENFQRTNFWAQLIAGMSYYESGWDPTNRYVETTMGKDPITGRQVASEGLLQLSYQDTTSYSFCDFDWNKDKNYSDTDSRKTILNPYKNLTCGVKILARQIQRKNQITVGSGAYWAVIKSNSSRNKISQIAAITKKLSFCQ